MIEIDFTLLYKIIDWILRLSDEFMYDLNTASEWQMIWLLLFKYQLWIVFIYIFLVYLAYPEYMYYIQGKWFAKNGKYLLLAIDVPKRNEQSIQAMENFFDHLQGAHGTFNKWEEYVEGAFQLSMSVELISIEGNVQFIIRCPVKWRNLVEAAVYAQYPDAEITEVEDYTNSVPKYYPSETHDLWGVEFSLANKNVYLPIRTWPKFEHRFSEKFVDPMAALLETMSSIGKGEQIWMQFILTPLEVGWGQKDGRAAINKAMKVPAPAPKAGMVSGFIGQLGGFASEFTTQLAGIDLTGAGGEVKKDEKSLPSGILYLSPGERQQIEDMEKKINKLAFRTKIRYIYVAEKEHMNKMLGVNAIIGSLKQWGDMNSNGLRPMLGQTSPSGPQYILKDYRRNTRKNIIMAAYRSRSTMIGITGKPMNSEELASVWHFPNIDIKAPLVKSTAYIKVSAPVSLPFEDRPVMAAPKAKRIEDVIADKTGVLPTFDYDNDAFEMQFAKDKQAFIKTRPLRAKRLEEIAQEDAKIAVEKAKAKEAAKIKPQLKRQTGVPAKAASPAQITATKPVNKAETPAPEPKKAPGNLPFID